MGSARVGAFALAAALALGVVGATPAAGGDTIPAPDGLPKFYAVPKQLPAKAGRLIKSQKVKAPEINGTLFRVMYTSTNLQDEIIPVTGVIVVPEGAAPDSGFPVLSWGHGTDGMADECAESLDPTGSAPAVNQLLEQGWIVTASDYEGEGTPGLHPYIAGEVAARNTVDIVRAARQLKGAKPSKDYVVWGHSQGGQTAMYALKSGADYAPELNLAGVVAGAPPSQFNLIYNFLKTSPFKHYLLMAAGGLNAAYGDKAAPLDEVLTPAGIELLPLLDQGCSGFVQDETADVAFDTVTKADPFTVPKWQKILEENDPQLFDEPSDARLLVIHGGNDEQIPTAASAIMSNHLCDIGQKLERWVYPGQSHAGVIGPSLTDMIGWINDRFASEPGPYTPTGQPDVEVTGCP